MKEESIVSMIEAMPKIQNDQLSDYLKFLETNRLFFIDEVRTWLNLLLKEEISMSKFVENFNLKLFNQHIAGRSASIESEKAKDERIKELEKTLEWYAEIAESANKKFNDKNAGEYLLALLTELNLDAGNRAKQLLNK